MTDYRKYINALRKCATEHDNDRTFTGHIIVSDLCRDTANLLEQLKQEPKTGHWVFVGEENEEETRKGNFRYICSECGYSDVHAKSTEVPYCWHCGAKMVEPQESEET